MMPSWIESVFAFLFKYRPEVFEKGDLVFGAPSSVMFLLALGLLIGGPAVMTYAGVRGKSTRRDRWILSGLRVASLVVLVLCLFRPMLLLSDAVPQRNFVAVLLDDSKSMTIADKAGRPRGAFEVAAFAPESTLLTELRRKFQVRLFRVNASAERIESTRGLTFEAQQTHIGDALERVRQELESVPVSGIVLVSDGADNSRAPIGDQLLSLRARSIPVFTVGVGEERFEKDIEIRRVEAPHAVMRGSAVAADVLIRQRGYSGRRLPILVEDDGRIVAADSIWMPNDGEVAPIRISVFLNRAGARALTFRIPLQAGEQVTQNNAAVALVDVRQRRERILYVEGEPRYEARFIRAAVKADSNLQLVTMQRTAEDKFLRLDVNTGEELVRGFPTTREELFSYRSIVLGSIEASFFSQEQMKMLSEFVSVRGGGMLFLGGRRAFAEGGYAGTPLADVMPVIIEGPPVPDSLTFFADLKATVTPPGRSAAVTQIAATPAQADARWRTLPAITSVNYIRRVKPGAITILQGVLPPTGRAGWPTQKLDTYTQPVLAYQRFGRGLSIAMPVQDSYQWQMDPAADSTDISYQTFWRQLLRQLTADVPGPLQLSVPTDQVMVGQPATIRATVTDSLYVPRNDAQVMMHVTGGVAGSPDVPMEWVVDRDGEYRATFTPTTNGLQVVRVEVTDSTGRRLSDSVVVRVGDMNAEYVDAEMRPSLLERIADETGGKFYRPDRVSTLVEDLAMSKNGVTVVNQMDLWDMPFLFLLLVALVSAEWAYRRARGLA
jgi:uncharacterized membrane protein